MALTLKFLSTGSHKSQLKWAAKWEECGKSKRVGRQKQHCQCTWLQLSAQRVQGLLRVSTESPPDWWKKLKEEKKATVYLASRISQALNRTLLSQWIERNKLVSKINSGVFLKGGLATPVTLRQEAFLQGFPRGSDGKESACNAGDCLQCSIPELGKPLEKGMATYSSILAWRTPWTEDPCRLQSMGSPSAGHDWVTNTHTGRTDSQTFGRRTQRHEVMTESLVFPSPCWVSYCLNSAGIRQVIQGSKYGHYSRVERTVASWGPPALQKCQSPFNTSPHGGPVWTHLLIFKRSGTINFNMNFSNFYNVGNDLKHIWAKQK